MSFIPSKGGDNFGFVVHIKVMTQADIGLGEAYINGDFSFMDKDGLLNLILVLIANKDTNSSIAKLKKRSGEQLENIGIHYYKTLRCWRQNFLNNKSKKLELGFDESFFRTWEYYFDYCAAGFKSRTLGDYQIVFSRPGNVATFKDPYEEIPSASNNSFNEMLSVN
ncbi:unnamed protein product [Citrullus colocynthis]|uniref:Cyclopropane-fatty-acyl-phospholipid synthase n=1 Tax=Citrullus colocynthis TaxID=252529 RepID=A0ABP0XRC1_9ROSI